MTTPATIAARVNAMHQARAAGPSAGPAGAFAREQAGLAASAGRHRPGAGTVCPTPHCSTAPGQRSRCRRRQATGPPSWCSTGAPGAPTATSPCPLTSRSYFRAGPARHPAGRDQPAEARRVADHAGQAQPRLRRGLRPGQRPRRSPRHPHPAVPEARAAQLDLGLDLTRPTPTAPRPCPCPPSSSSTPAAPSGGSTSTPTTAPAPNPSKSSTPWVTHKTPTVRNEPSSRYE